MEHAKTRALKPIEKTRMVASLIALTSQNIQSGRLGVAGDYLELLYLADPTSKKAMVMRAQLFDKEGDSQSSEIYRKISKCL